MYEALIAHLRECAKLDISNNTYKEAADAIDELDTLLDGVSADNDALCETIERMKKPHWIPVTERLPEERKGVLIWERRYPLPYAASLFSDGWYIIGSCGVRVALSPTHWMPLPTPPKEET